MWCLLLFFFFIFVHSFVDTTAPDPYYTQICVLCATADTLIHAFHFFFVPLFLVERMFARHWLKKKNEIRKMRCFFSLALNKFVFHSISNKGATKNYYSVRDLSWYTYLFIERKKNIIWTEPSIYVFIFTAYTTSNRWVLFSFSEFHISIWKKKEEGASHTSGFIESNG